MSGPDCKKVSQPAVPDPGKAKVERSGAGAQTALLAMLRKRQMRASNDPDPLPAEADESKVPDA